MDSCQKKTKKKIISKVGQAAPYDPTKHGPVVYSLVFLLKIVLFFVRRRRKFIREEVKKTRLSYVYATVRLHALSKLVRVQFPLYIRLLDAD